VAVRIGDAPLSFAGHQFPPEVIRHAVWLYLRFTLSFRDVEDLLAERGIDVSYKTVRRWVLKFGPIFARELRLRGLVTSRGLAGCSATIWMRGRVASFADVPEARSSCLTRMLPSCSSGASSSFGSDARWIA